MVYVFDFNRVTLLSAFYIQILNSKADVRDSLIIWLAADCVIIPVFLILLVEID